jgi:predicted nucleotidyltransferase
MTLMEIIRNRRSDIIEIAARHGANNIRLFGSTVRDEVTPESDIDILVDVGPVTSSWFPAGLIVDLEKLLGFRVEIVTERGLNPHIREYILQEAVPL